MANYTNTLTIDISTAIIDKPDNYLLKQVDNDILKDFYGQQYIDELAKEFNGTNYYFQINIQKKLLGMNYDEAIDFLQENDLKYIDGNKGYQGLAIGGPLTTIILYSTKTHDSHIITKIDFTTDGMKQLN